MSNERKIPDARTRARSVAKLQELVARMDGHIADLDRLNAHLAAENENTRRGAYLKRREQRLAGQQPAAQIDNLRF
jgi:hypothetical protein